MLNVRASKRSHSPVLFSFSSSGAGAGTGTGTGNMQGARYRMPEKDTMRGLNERLKDYLGEVRLLEEANSKLEAQIKQVLAERRAAGGRDWSGYHNMLSILREQVRDITMENASLMLHIDNARLAADDFKVKLETEAAVRQAVEQDIANLRKLVDDTNLSRMHLEGQIESLRDELNFLTKNHKEDVADLQGKIRASNVDVQMEATRGQDLTETIERIRQQYEKAAQKNRDETEAWYQAKFDSISVEVNKSSDELQQGKGELSDVRRQKQALEIDLQAMHSMNQSLQETLKNTTECYSQEMYKHNTVIQNLEAELADLHTQVLRQGAEYQTLLNVKSKLEEEIATYHQLLDAMGRNEINDAELHQNDYKKGSGAREDAKIKNIGLPEDANFKTIGLPEDVKNNSSPKDANTGENDLAGNYDESVDFSLEQALNAAPFGSIPDPSLTVNEKPEDEEMITQKEQELNAANINLSKQLNLDEAGRQEGEESQNVITEIEPMGFSPVKHLGSNKEAVEGRGVAEEKRNMEECRAADEEVKSSMAERKGAGEEAKSSMAECKWAGEKVKGSMAERKGAGEEAKSSMAEHKGAGEEAKSSMAEHKGAGEEAKSSMVEHKGAGEEVKGSMAECKGAGEEAKSSMAECKWAVEEAKSSMAEWREADEEEISNEDWREADEEINSMADDEEFSSITDGRGADEERNVECTSTDEGDEERNTPIACMKEEQIRENQEEVEQECFGLKMTEV